MYEDRTQIVTQKFAKKYLIHDNPFPCHIIYSHVQTTA